MIVDIYTTIPIANDKAYSKRRDGVPTIIFMAHVTYDAIRPRACPLFVYMKCADGSMMRV